MSPRVTIYEDPVGEIIFEGDLYDQPGSGYRRTEGTMAVVRQHGFVELTGPAIEGTRYAGSGHPTGDMLNIRFGGEPTRTLALIRERDGVVLKVSAEALGTRSPERG